MAREASAEKFEDLEVQNLDLKKVSGIMFSILRISEKFKIFSTC